MLTTTVLFLIWIGLVCIVWGVFYLLLNAFLKIHGATFAALITLLLTPHMFKTAYELYGSWDKFYFQRNESGNVQLEYAPLKIPKGTKDKLEYCEQFLDQDNKPINAFSFGDDSVYCGVFLNIRKETPIILPYKILTNGKADYWIGPGLRIIGTAPKSQV